MIGSPTEEWGELPSPGLMFCKTSTQEVRKTEPINNSVRKGDAILMHVGNTVLAAAEETKIDENWFLLDNQSTCNTFINKKYLSKIRDDPDGQYLCVHFNAGVTQTNKIDDLSGYSDYVWYNTNGIANILSLSLAQKNNPVTYNTRYGYKFLIYIPQRPPFNMTKAGLFYRDI